MACVERRVDWRWEVAGGVNVKHRARLWLEGEVEGAGEGGERENKMEGWNQLMLEKFISPVQLSITVSPTTANAGWISLTLQLSLLRVFGNHMPPGRKEPLGEANRASARHASCRQQRKAGFYEAKSKLRFGTPSRKAWCSSCGAGESGGGAP